LVLSLSKLGYISRRCISFNLINKGSEILIEEFPSSEDLLIQKKKLKKFNSDKLREECGIFGISNHEDASALVALGLHAYNIEVKKVVE
jgi:hypothetical protein